jgi:hypothetical protein
VRYNSIICYVVFKINVRENWKDNENSQSRETGNIGHTRHKTKEKTKKGQNNTPPNKTKQRKKLKH